MDLGAIRNGRPPRHDAAERVRICLRLKERIYTEARAEARNKGIPVSDLIEIAIEKFLKKSA